MINEITTSNGVPVNWGTLLVNLNNNFRKLYIV